MSFDTAFELLMANEGGFVDDPSDNGGETNMGISKQSYPDVDIKNLTRDEAKEIYRKDFWELHHCDQMPWAIGWTFLDCIVNHGPYEPTKWLQAALGVVADGKMGPKTLAAAGAAKEPIHVARDMTLIRRDYCEQIHNYDRFKAGWNRRHLDVLIGAVQWEPSTSLVSAV